MRIAALTVLIGALCLSACDGTSDVILIPISRTGTFILQQANGRSLPATIVDSVSPPLRIDVVSGTFTILSNNTFTETASLRQLLGGTITMRTMACTGTYTVVGNTFSFVESPFAPDCGRTFTGTLVGTTLRTTLLGATAVYIR